MERFRRYWQRFKENFTKENFKHIWKKYHKRLIISTAAIVLLFLIITPIATYFYFAKDIATKENIMNSNNTGVLLLDRNGKPFFSFYQAKQRKFVELSNIPQYMQDAAIASEDKDFYKHPGFSIPGILRAVILNLQEEKLAFGGSTITQQLVKTALLSFQKNFLRKYQEVVLAAEIERRYSKKEILEMYLNSVYFGEGAIGIDDAAHTYFSKTPKELTLAESSLLTAILPAPSAFSPISGDKDEAIRRQKRVLKLMQQQGYITKQQQETAENETIVFTPGKDTSINFSAPHFALMVKSQLLKTYSEEELARSGFKVTTTLNLDWQTIAETVVKNQIARLQYNKASNGAQVSIDPRNGEILTLVGSYDWEDEVFGKYNIVTGKRQPGSAFKPIVYAKALADETITAGTVLEDKEITFDGNYKPKNYDGKFRGPVLPRRALANSLNIPALLVMQKVGIPATIDFAKQLGITSLKNPSQSPYGLSLVLGAAEVPLIELTSAYGVFANKGNLVPPTTILSIKDKFNNTVFTYVPKSQQVLDSRVAFLISSMLSDNSARSESFGNALSISRPAAVKTGTTNDYRDALTVGYTPSLVIGVWVGNNDNTPMDTVAGSLGAAPIWRQLMEQFLKGTSVEHFNPPSGLDLTRICRINGLKSRTATSSAYFEYFLSGSTPNGFCDEEASPTPSPSPTTTPGPTDTPAPEPSATPTSSEQPSATPTILQDTPTPTLTPPITLTITP
ncbi:MAG: PBP1A family penicillin-binding protein [Candidatus Levybacteria bacterium]|nr:PBP1A family penicillin-binding protein [Candidatus Levybacteria bacterium]